MVAALKMPHSGLIHALCCAEARSRGSWSSSSRHWNDRIKKYIVSRRQSWWIPLWPALPMKLRLDYPPCSYTVIKKHAEGWMGKSNLSGTETMFDLFSHSKGCEDSYMPPACGLPVCVDAVCIILLYTLYLVHHPCTKNYQGWDLSPHILLHNKRLEMLFPSAPDTTRMLIITAV